MNDKAWNIIQWQMKLPQVFDVFLHLRLQKDPASRTPSSLSTWLLCDTRLILKIH